MTEIGPQFNASMGGVSSMLTDIAANITGIIGNVVAAEPADYIQNPSLNQIIELASNFRVEYPYILLILIPMLLTMALYVLRGGLNRKKITYTLTRSAMLSLIVLIMSSPFLLKGSTKIQDVPPVTIMVDASPSMMVYGNETKLIAEKLSSDLNILLSNLTGSPYKVDVEFFSDYNRTELGDALYNGLIKSERGESIFILISDGNNNYGRNPFDVADKMADSNSTVYAVAPELKEGDVYIKELVGEKKIPVNVEYNMDVQVNKIGDEPANYALEIYVDEKLANKIQVTQDSRVKTIPMKNIFTFERIGVHRLEARITPNSKDFFPQNNRLYKVVEVVEKPRVLVVSNKTTSQLTKVLDEICFVEASRKIPKDVSGYTAIFLDDVSTQDIQKADVDELRDYVLGGKGLGVVGGKNSFEYGGYHNSNLERLLPVESTEKPEEERKPVGFIFLVDLSSSMAYGFGGVEPDEYEKALIIDFIKRSMDPQDYLGVIAFNIRPFVVVDLQEMGILNQADLIERVRRLQAGYSRSGERTAESGTDVYTTLIEAEEMFEGFSYQRRVILFSDGPSAINKLDRICAQLERMNEKKIVVDVVGIAGGSSNLGSNPENPNPFSERVLREYAICGGGEYYGPNTAERERFIMDFGEEDEPESKLGYRLEVRNKYHFITRGLREIDRTSVSGYNKVNEKSIAELLITTGRDQPILTVWRFGLGRVAALTTDDGGEWAPNVYLADSGKLVSGLTNWLIGDLEKGKPVRIVTSDMSLGDRNPVVINSRLEPSLVARHHKLDVTYGIQLKRVDVDVYGGVFTPEDTGFYELTAKSITGLDTDAIAVNYPIEFSGIGLDLDALTKITETTGGRVYSRTEKPFLLLESNLRSPVVDAPGLPKLESDILDHAKRISTKEVKERIPLWTYFTGLLLLLYFTDTVVRRIRDILRLSRR